MPCHSGRMDCPQLTYIGGPTVLMRYAGLTFVTDPTFDPPGDHGGLVKTEGPGIEAGDLPTIDVALISHDHHPDNLDDAGREVALGAALALTTTAGAARVPGLVGLDPGDTIAHGPVTITAVAALHGPPGVAEQTGPVIGFIVRAADCPAVYFSGDNSEVSVASAVAAAHPDVRLAILCMGAARVATRGPDPLTLDVERAVAVAKAFPDALIVPVHVEDWAHFSEDRETSMSGLRDGGVGQRLVDLERGVPTVLEP